MFQEALRPRLAWCLGLLCIAVLWADVAHAEPEVLGRYWRGVDVPGAVCGDGRPYKIFISPGDPKRIMIELMGGGACWDAATCYVLPDTWVHPLPTVLEPGGIVSPFPWDSPMTEHTIVYFPYCTGDVHLGSHVTRYLPGKRFHHVGATNFPKGLKTIVDRGEVDLAHANQVVVMGYSAGAIGALFHVFDVEPYVRNVKDKVLIADAPGLHFGPRFWDKFTPELMRDFGKTMGQVGLKPRRGEGNLAQAIPRVCAQLPDWRVGVLQGSRDLVMSGVFGAISPEDHERAVYGSRGVYQLTMDAADNCSTWAPSSLVHTFLATTVTSRLRASTGESAMDFVRGLVSGAFAREGARAAAGPNYR